MNGGYQEMTFAEKIKKARKEKHYTQKQFADLVSVSLRTVANWEKGNSMPDEAIRQKVYAILDCDTDDREGQYVYELFLDEKRLIENYRKLDDEGKTALRQMARLLEY